VWITYYQTDSVVRLDPSTGKIVATIPVASGPRFFDVGAGAVWVMAQSAGVLCRIDPAGNRLVGCTVIDPAGVQGGDLTVGDGFVWFRGTEALGRPGRSQERAGSPADRHRRGQRQCRRRLRAALDLGPRRGQAVPGAGELTPRPARRARLSSPWQQSAAAG
jgi:hypothetical protein